jgi:hypothetical protein
VIRGKRASQRAGSGKGESKKKKSCVCARTGGCQRQSKKAEGKKRAREGAWILDGPDKGRKGGKPRARLGRSTEEKKNATPGVVSGWAPISSFVGAHRAAAAV